MNIFVQRGDGARLAGKSSPKLCLCVGEGRVEMAADTQDHPSGSKRFGFIKMKWSNFTFGESKGSYLNELPVIKK